MNVLIACERSGRVRDAFAAYGHNAWSCDLMPSRNGGNHFQCDALSVIGMGWDLIIAHPECTFIAISAEWAYTDGPYHQKVKPGTLTGRDRIAAREEAAAFFMKLYNAPAECVCIENPVGVMSTRFRKPDQSIQPYEFGEDASKKTCLWLRGLPKLRGTSYFPPREVEYPAGSGKFARRWGNQTDSGQNRLGPSDDRSEARSVTYRGIAEAMANQWG